MDEKIPKISQKTKKNKKNKGGIAIDPCHASVCWKNSVVEDEFESLFEGTEGGFMSLEEIDADSYSLGEEGNLQSDTTGKKSKKRKLEEVNKESQKDEESMALAPEPDKKKRKKKNKKRKKKQSVDAHIPEDIGDTDIKEEQQFDSVTVTNNELEDATNKDDDMGHEFDDEEFAAWREMRLHPLLQKAIRDLGFKEPSPIQKCCIPAAAHQGKDVIGAAETGSGKTLAFGLPILQRLLEEQEKAARKDGLTDIKEKISPEASVLRALIVAPTRELALQVCDHLRAASKHTNIKVVPIVGGIAPQKQERFLKRKPHIIVGTPGRLWELMGGGEKHLVELHSLSFFVLDEADRMVEKGHFHELQSIIGMLPLDALPNMDVEKPNYKKKRRQTFVFSATIALSSGFRKKLKRGSNNLKQVTVSSSDSLDALCQRAGLRENAAVFDLTSASIVAHKLEESVVECREEDKDAYLYYILKVHGCGRTIVFCTSISALRRISAILRILKVTAWPLHAQMQQRARLKAMDHFKQHEDSVLVATDVAARGLDIPGVRTVIHYQLPHSAEIYIHRSGRTARASADGCSIALISPSDKSKYVSLCRSFSKDGYQTFPVNLSYMPEVEKRMLLARHIDQILRKTSKTKAEKSWLERNAGALEINIEGNESEEEKMKTSSVKKADLFRAKRLQKELDQLSGRPLRPKSLSHRFICGSGMSSLLQGQLQEMTNKKSSANDKIPNKRAHKQFFVIGEEAVEPLFALKNQKLHKKNLSSGVLRS